MQGFPASLYSKPTERRRPAERPVVLVTDRPNPKSAISDALQVIAAVEVVGPDETWDRPGAIAGVVCDLTLARPQAAHCLRRLQARYAGVEPPLLCLLRQVTSGAVLEAKALGAAACLSVDAPPRNIVQALFKIIPDGVDRRSADPGFCGADRGDPGRPLPCRARRARADDGARRTCTRFGSGRHGGGRPQPLA